MPGERVSERESLVEARLEFSNGRSKPFEKCVYAIEVTDLFLSAATGAAIYLVCPFIPLAAALSSLN